VKKMHDNTLSVTFQMHHRHPHRHHLHDRDHADAMYHESTYVQYPHASARTSRALLSHTHALKPKEARIATKYLACATQSMKEPARIDAKEMEQSTPQQTKDFIEKRERASEIWLNEVATSIIEKHSISAQLAFQTFAPSPEEPLSEIFAKYSGAPQ